MAFVNYERLAGEMVGLLGMGPREKRARLARKQLRRSGRQDREVMKLLAKKLSLADRLGLPGAQISRGGPPALAETQYGDTVVQQGSVAQGKIFPLGQTSIGGTGVAVAGVPLAGTLEVRAERSFRPTRLILVASIDGVATVSDISVGTARQLATLEVMPIEIFAPTTTSAWIDFDIIEPGILASVDLIFTPAADDTTLVVSGAYYGTEL
jgi:hypothetical protein